MPPSAHTRSQKEPRRAQAQTEGPRRAPDTTKTRGQGGHPLYTYIHIYWQNPMGKINNVGCPPRPTPGPKRNQHGPRPKQRVPRRAPDTTKTRGQGGHPLCTYIHIYIYTYMNPSGPIYVGSRHGVSKYTSNFRCNDNYKYKSRNNNARCCFKRR